MSTYDPEIKHAFEVADDSLQGVLGYHYFILALKYTIDEDQIKNLPDGWGFILGEGDRGTFLHTYSWERYFSPSVFLNEMVHHVDEYESRISLVFMTNVFRLH